MKCSLLVNFNKEPAEKDLNRIKMEAKKYSNLCEDCDDNVMVWPPRLLLSDTGLKEGIAFILLVFD